MEGMDLPHDDDMDHGPRRGPHVRDMDQDMIRWGHVMMIWTVGIWTMAPGDVMTIWTLGIWPMGMWTTARGDMRTVPCRGPRIPRASPAARGLAGRDAPPPGPGPGALSPRLPGAPEHKSPGTRVPLAGINVAQRHLGAPGQSTCPAFGSGRGGGWLMVPPRCVNESRSVRDHQGLLDEGLLAPCKRPEWVLSVSRVLSILVRGLSFFDGVAARRAALRLLPTSRAFGGYPARTQHVRRAIPRSLRAWKVA